MLVLKKNDVPIACGGPAVMDRFEDAIDTWNTERSGWDAEGNFYTMHVIIEFDFVTVIIVEDEP